MKYLLIAFVLLMFSVPSSVNADGPGGTALQELVDELDAQGIPYVIMTQTVDGVQTIHVIQLNAALPHLLESSSVFTSFGLPSTGGFMGGFGSFGTATLSSYIDFYNLSHDDNCAANPTCLGSTSGSIGGS